MKSKLSTILLSIIFTSTLASQDLVLGFQTGMGNYHMGSLKSLNTTVLNSLPFDAEIVSNYPNHVYFKPTVKINYNNNNYGLAYSILSTGSRISYADYSGEYLFDTRINGKSFGVFYDHSFLICKWLKLGIGLEAGFNSTKLVLDEYFQVGETSQNDTYKFSSKCNYLQPNLNIIYPYKDLCVELNLGYYKEFNRGKLEDKDGKEIQTSEDWGEFDMWDGYRLGITLSYPIFKNINLSETK